ncbi:hypothetical protein RFI_11769 [Reticulomyxa filosa]|uniref:PB1 domain-containing protein n=1 Tax=Reticulomyxa filosa TaxID=46433 RepID=X6NGD1_RETFI|nr:hypothetical protein RFI_11769 [Reticulomyxa filosa]|eukprot:ETO25365.1 hypothetical protein RFI_11769 [Reticulomyxa filosa]
MTEIKVKVIYGKDIRRWHYPTKDRYNDLLAFVEKSFKLGSNAYYLQFEDEELDKLTISNPTDFDDAFSCAEQEQRMSLKIFVVKGSIENAQKVLSNGFVCVQHVKKRDLKRKLVEFC